MTLNLNAPNFSGLSTRSSSNLNLESPTRMGLLALQQIQQRRNQQQQLDLARQQLQQQGQMGLLSNQNARDELQLKKYLAEKNDVLKRQALLQDARQFQDKLGFNREELGQQGSIEATKLAQRQQEIEMVKQQQEMARLVDMDKKELKARGDFASYAKIALSRAETPEAAEQIRQEILKEAKSKGYYNKDQIAQARKMPLSMFKNMVDYEIMKNNAVAQTKSMLDMDKQSISEKANKMIRHPDGSVEFIVDPGTVANNQVGKDLINAQDNRKALMRFFKNVPDNYFGAAAVGQYITEGQEWAEGLPFVGKHLGPSQKDKDDLKRYSALKADTEMFAMNTIKQLSGVQYSDRQLEYMKKIVPSIGPGTVKSVFEGRVQALDRLFNQIEEDKAKVLAEGGVRVGTPEYQKKMRALMDQRIGGGGDDSLFQQYRNDPRYKNVSDDELRARIRLLNGDQ